MKPMQAYTATVTTRNDAPIQPLGRPRFSADAMVKMSSPKPSMNSM